MPPSIFSSVIIIANTRNLFPIIRRAKNSSSISYSISHIYRVKKNDIMYDLFAEIRTGCDLYDRNLRNDGYRSPPMLHIDSYYVCHESMVPHEDRKCVS